MQATTEHATLAGFWNNYPQEAYEFLTETRMGNLLFSNILIRHGEHVLILGSPGSGKTQKLTFLAAWLAPLETIVWVDSCKDNECTPLLTFGRKIRFIIPAWCSLEVENSPCEYEVVEAGTPESVWQLVKPGAINILPIRLYFRNERARSVWLRDMFKGLIEQAYNIGKKKQPNLNKILPLSVFADEFHNFCPSQNVTSDRGRIAIGQEIAINILEGRAFDIRLVGGTQDWSSLNPIARRNLPSRVCCRGTVISQSDSPQLFRIRKYFAHYNPNQGLFVFSNGEYYPTNQPWSFPFFRHPDKCNVVYNGWHDEPETGWAEFEQHEQLIGNWERYAGIYAR